MYTVERHADLRRTAAFDFGVAALPHYDDVRGAPHHSLIGGGGLWVLAGGKPAEYRAVAKFLAYLSRPEVQAEWHQRTGYVPTTRAAYERTREQGFYAVHPGQEIAIRQLLLHAPTRESRGIRLGDFEAIRTIIEDELETVWSGAKPPKLALDVAAERGNEILRRFEAAHRAGERRADELARPHERGHLGGCHGRERDGIGQPLVLQSCNRPGDARLLPFGEHDARPGGTGGLEGAA